MRIGQVTAANGASQDRQLRKVCRQVEGVFLNYLLKSMRKTVTTSDLFGSAGKEELFRDMLDSEICERAAETQSMGLGDLLYRQLSPALHPRSAKDASKTP